jgi:lysophospholipase L1-like esterase
VTSIIKLIFNSNQSITVQGISLENNFGVKFDNIAVRGSGGLEFYKPDRLTFLQTSKKIHPDLIILQFGVNVVPPDYENYKFYENALYKQIQYIKSIYGNVPVVVMGVSDISNYSDGNYFSYKCIEKVIEAQKNAAFRSGVIFWNTLEAMGGLNSMPLWVNHSPPLATKDYIHFSYKGSTIIAEMFTKALLKDYKTYNGDNK